MYRVLMWCVCSVETVIIVIVVVVGIVVIAVIIAVVVCRSYRYITIFI